MSEQKAKCEKCGEEVSESVEAYSKKNFDGHVYCYPKCQKKVRGDEDTGSWTYDPPKENAEKKGASSKSDGDVAKSSDDEKIELATELKQKSKELDKKIISLVTAMNRQDTEGFYKWLKSEYDVDDLETLTIEQKRRVLNETEIMAAGKESEKVVEQEKWHKTVKMDEGAFSFREEGEEKLLCRDGADKKVYTLNITVPDCSCAPFWKDKSKWCLHLKAAAVAGYKVRELPLIKESAEGNANAERKVATAQKQIEIDWDEIPVQVLIPKLKKALEYTCEEMAVHGLYRVESKGVWYETSINSCECQNWEREGSSINPCKHMIRVKYRDDEIRAKLKQLGADELPMPRENDNGIAVQEPITDSDMMITGMTPQLAEVGKIKIGVKGEKMVRGHLLPKKLDHFMIATLMKDDDGRLEMDDSMNKIIGDKCTSLDICLCYDDFTMNMTSSYSWFAQSKLVCMGNGQTAMRRKEDGSEEKIICNPKECTAYKEKKCKPYGRLSVILTSANRIGGVYVLRTTGWNTIRNVLSSMAFIRKEAGGVLAGLPLRMKLLPMTVTPRDVGHNVKIYSVNIEYPGTLSELKQAGAEEMERRLKLGINMKQTEDRYRESVKARMKEEAEEDARDIAEELGAEGE